MENTMKLRDYGKRCGLQVAPVSIGSMRFPADTRDSVEMIRHAIDNGMKYIDTSRGYGESEFVLGAALRDGYREKVFLSTKWSPWIKMVRPDDNASESRVRKRLEESLTRLGVDYLDFYQLWNINNPENWEKATRKGGMMDGIKKAMDEGLVRHTGMTSHEKPGHLLKYLDQAEWCEIILLTYNLLNQEYAPVLEKAKKLGIGTAVMNPVGGGKLSEASPVLMKLAKEVGAVSVPDLAVRYVLSNPNVDTILCGMTRQRDVDDTIQSAEQDAFSREQLKTIHEFMQGLNRRNVKACTQCGYCEPCPEGIKISNIMNAVYEDRILGLKKSAKKIYQRAVRDVTPDACRDCGRCELKCTQNIPIVRELNAAMEAYGTNG